ncbi:OmpA family protein [Amycolatopsis sp. NPDC024027]|uniref:OmpA family protein n=1 Tax=Amycolatopsis sp. NPDC024027 TaxID=3154327 RepID=UPI0033D865B3
MSSIVLAAVGNLATSTISVSGVWIGVVWVAFVLLAAPVVLETTRAGASVENGRKPVQRPSGGLAGRWYGPDSDWLRDSRAMLLTGIAVTLAVTVTLAVSQPAMPPASPDAVPEAGDAARISCPIESGPLTLAVSGRQGSPGFVMDSDVEQFVRKVIDRPEQTGPVSLVTIDGRPGLAKRVTAKQLTANGAAHDESVQLLLGTLKSDAAAVRAVFPEADLLGALDTAARSNKPQNSGTIIAFDSGLSTTGGVKFDSTTTIDADAKDLLQHLDAAGYLPDLSGITVVFVGLGETSPPQDPLRPAQRKHLSNLWEAVARHAGAQCVATVDEPAQVGVPLGVPPVRSVHIPPPPQAAASGADDSFVLSTNGELQFLPESAKFENPTAAAQALESIAKAISGPGVRQATITGTTADIGSKNLQRSLSAARARAVADLLVQAGVPADRMTTRGVGSDFPEYVPDHSPGGTPLPGPAQQNRTVRIDLVRS